MKRIMLVGNCPLPEENTLSRPAAGLRTYQFLRVLRDSGFEVKTALIAMTECYGGAPERSEGAYPEGVYSKDDRDLIVKIQSAHDTFHPEAIVAVNTFPSYIASLLNFRAPLWADLNGWIMAEAQAQAYRDGGNEYLGHYSNMEHRILRKADKFSAVSRAQSFALLGELAMCGRLGKESFGYSFVEHIPNATQWFAWESGAITGDGISKIQIAGVPDGAFVLLWMGGYNTWADESNLFKGVEDAMRRCEDIYFVSTGGAIKGLGSETFRHFNEMVEKSEFRKRFVFTGWVETAKIPSIYQRADVGLNVDRMCAETMTGARNRINEMMKFGLPVISTLGSEISFEMAACGAGIGVESGRHEALTEAILRMYDERRGPQFGRYGEKGREYVESCDYDLVMRPLLKWLENPRPAPDSGVVARLGGGGGLFGGRFSGLSPRALWKYLRENGFKKSFAKFKQRLGR